MRSITFALAAVLALPSLALAQGPAAAGMTGGYWGSVTSYTQSSGFNPGTLTPWTKLDLTVTVSDSPQMYQYYRIDVYAFRADDLYSYRVPSALLTTTTGNIADPGGTWTKNLTFYTFPGRYYFVVDVVWVARVPDGEEWVYEDQEVVTCTWGEDLMPPSGMWFWMDFPNPDNWY